MAEGTAQFEDARLDGTESVEAPSGRKTWSTPLLSTYDIARRTGKVGSTTDNISTPSNS